MSSFFSQLVHYRFELVSCIFCRSRIQDGARHREDPRLARAGSEVFVWRHSLLHVAIQKLEAVKSQLLLVTTFPVLLQWDLLCFCVAILSYKCIPLILPEYCLVIFLCFNSYMWFYHAQNVRALYCVYTHELTNTIYNAFSDSMYMYMYFIHDWKCSKNVLSYRY